MCLSQGALNATQAENYFEEHYSRDYYSESHHTVGQWVGKGTMNLGLVGEMSTEHFAELLEDTHPHTRAVLVPLATHNSVHRAGWDSVFSVPKSIRHSGTDGR